MSYAFPYLIIRHNCYCHSHVQQGIAGSWRLSYFTYILSLKKSGARGQRNMSLSGARLQASRGTSLAVPYPKHPKAIWPAKPRRSCNASSTEHIHSFFHSHPFSFVPWTALTHLSEDAEKPHPGFSLSYAWEYLTLLSTPRTSCQKIKMKVKVSGCCSKLKCIPPNKRHVKTLTPSSSMGPSLGIRPLNI